MAGRRMIERAALCAGGVVLVLAGSAAAQPPADARFRPELFFAGRAASHGTIRTALVSVEAFTADFEGRARGRSLVLDERFHFADGERLQRWRLRRTGEGTYGGTVETEGADGRLHEAVPVEGRTSPAGVELDYDGYAPGGDTRLHFRHRMAMQPDGTVSNKVRISKFGVPIAGADVVFERARRDARGKLR